MKRRVARALADHITELIDTMIPGEGPIAAAARTRLRARATRHLPTPGAPEGSPLWPPAYALRLSDALALDPKVALGFAAAGALFFAAADLADDIADGDADDVPNGVNDVCRLLMMTQDALLSLDGVEPARKIALARAFAAEGQTMALGQELDIRGTNAQQSAAPARIATLKSGAEFALFTAGPARLAGHDPAPFAAFGRAFGCLGQTLSDAFDLFLDPEGDDWAHRKPTFALRRALAEDESGGRLHTLVAGANHRRDRRGPGLWQLVHFGAGRRLEEIRDDCVAQMTAAIQGAGGLPLLSTLRDELVAWTTGVCEALEVFAGEPPPSGGDVDGDLPRARRGLGAFLAEAEAARTLRWGLLGADEVPDSRLGPLVVAELRVLTDSAMQPKATALVEALPPEGWAQFDHPNAPLCTETTARAVRLAARLGRGAEANVVAAARVLARHQRRDGLFTPWLGGKRDPRRLDFVARWGETPCPAQSAWAALALWSIAPGSAPAASKAAAALSALYGGEETPASPFYGPVSVDAAGARALKAMRAALTEKARDAADDALAAIIRRTRRRLRLDGRMGDVLETAQGAWLLYHLGVMTDVKPAMRALLDAQETDGGYPACPFRRESAPGGARPWWGNRAITAAFVERLFEMGVP